MFTISEISRQTGLPRPVIQFWANENVIEPIDPMQVDSPRRRYAAREIEVAKILRQFHEIKVQVDMLQLLAIWFRHMLDPDNQSADELKLYGPAIDAGRRGFPAFFAVQMYKGKEGKLNIAIVAGTGRVGKIEILDDNIRERAVGPLVIVDLIRALGDLGEEPKTKHSAFRRLDRGDAKK